MAINLPPSINTPQLLEAVRFEVERLRTWMSDTAVKQKVGAAPAPEPGRSPETEKIIRAWTGNKPATVNQLTELLSELRTLKPVTVHIVLAALPAEGLRLQLVEWFRTTCRPDLLLSFSADRTIGGGIIIRTPNRIFDYSFRQRLVEGRKKLPEIVRHV